METLARIGVTVGLASLFALVANTNAEGRERAWANRSVAVSSCNSSYSNMQYVDTRPRQQVQAVQYHPVLVRPGYYQRVYHPPAYQTRCDRNGRCYNVQVSPGYHKDVWVAPIYETRPVTVCPPIHHYGHAQHPGSRVAVSAHVRF